MRPVLHITLGDLFGLGLLAVLLLVVAGIYAYALVATWWEKWMGRGGKKR